jgi:hypothetical protein
MSISQNRIEPRPGTARTKAPGQGLARPWAETRHSAPRIGRARSGGVTNVPGGTFPLALSLAILGLTVCAGGSRCARHPLRDRLPELEKGDKRACAVGGSGCGITHMPPCLGHSGASGASTDIGIAVRARCTPLADVVDHSVEGLVAARFRHLAATLPVVISDTEAVRLYGRRSEGYSQFAPGG